MIVNETAIQADVACDPAGARRRRRARGHRWGLGERTAVLLRGQLDEFKVQEVRDALAFELHPLDIEVTFAALEAGLACTADGPVAGHRRSGLPSPPCGMSFPSRPMRSC